MRQFFLATSCLITFFANPARGEDVAMRFHAQWNVDEGTQQRIQEAYGGIDFDKEGQPLLPEGLGSVEMKRWERLYKLCMSDGCYYCDANEGSCELGTCGINNENCKPYIGRDGQPICGAACADFAFSSILLCSGRS